MRRFTMDKSRNVFVKRRIPDKTTGVCMGWLRLDS